MGLNNFDNIEVDVSSEISGFDGKYVIGAGNHIVFAHIPVGVSVEFTFDNNSNSRIIAKQGMVVRIPHRTLHLWTTGTSAELMKIFHWGGDEIDIIMPPESTFEQLNNFGSSALASLDKVIEPYDVQNSAFVYGTGNLTTLTTLLSFVSVDTVRIKGYLVAPLSFSNGASAGSIGIFVNGNQVGASYAYSNQVTGTFKFDLNISIGDTVEVKSISASTSYISSYYLEKIKLKA